MNKQVKQNTFFGHPGGLFNLFSTEFCERFSYYGMRAILVYYIYAEVANGGLGLPTQDALYAITIFGAAVYLLSIVGGWFADRVIGSYRAVFTGGCIIALGHILLSLPFTGAPGTFAALACIALGTGFLKPNVAQMIGELYDEGDRRREAGFNLFVMGINLGAIISPLIVGSVQLQFGYHIAFSIPAVFMFIALAVYRFLQPSNLENISKKPTHPITKAEVPKFVIGVAVSFILIAILVVILVLNDILSFESFSIVLPVVSIMIVVYLFASMIFDKGINKTEKNHVIVYIMVFLAATIFWSIEEMQMSIFAVLAESRANNSIGNFEVPPAWYQSINPIVIVLIAPLLAILWQKWLRQPSTFVKISFGLFLTVISFILPGITFGLAGYGTKISPLILIIPIILFSVGELFIQPVGLNATSELAPRKYQSRLLAMWYLADALGQGINSFSVRFFNEDNPSGFFFGYAFVAALVIAVILVLLKPLKKLAA